MAHFRHSSALQYARSGQGEYHVVMHRLRAHPEHFTLTAGCKGPKPCTGQSNCCSASCSSAPFLRLTPRRMTPPPPPQARVRHHITLALSLLILDKLIAANPILTEIAKGALRFGTLVNIQERTSVSPSLLGRRPSAPCLTALPTMMALTVALASLGYVSSSPSLHL